MADMVTIAAMLSIILPLVFIPVFAVLGKSSRKAKNTAYMVSIIAHAAVVTLSFYFVMNTGELSFNMGSLNFVMTPWLFIIASAIVIANIAVMFYNVAYNHMDSTKYGMFYCLLLSGIIGAVFASNVITIFIFLDLTLFSAGYLICTAKGDVKAAYKFTFMNLLASVFILAAIMPYGAITGGYSILQLSQLPTIVLFSLLIGLMIKVGSVPFNVWMPPAYSDSPAPVAASLAGSAHAISLLAMMKFLPMMNIGYVLQPIGLLTALFASLVAISQSSMRRTFSYFSIAETGFIVYALGLGSAAALAGAFILIVSQIFAKTLLFLLGGLAEEKRMHEKYYSIELLGLVAGGLSTAGIPFTGGAAGKFLILSASIASGNYLSLIVLMLSSLLLLMAFLKVYKNFSEIKSGRKPDTATAVMLVVLSIAVIATTLLLWVI